MNHTFIEYWLLILILLTGLLILITTFLIQKILNQVLLKAKGEEIKERKSWWERFKGLNPLEKEKELILPHSYDGIQELDNPTPPWFMWLFYTTILFGGIYVLYYHVSDYGNLQNSEYQAEIKAASSEKEDYLKQFADSINEDNVEALTDAASIEEGKKYFSNCVACHGNEGQGGIGPNLTDEYWLHGGDIKSIFKTITEGIPEKGMISWKSSMDPLQIQKVSSYIISIKGSNPPGAKEPQGEKL